jgi:hypothetical protein
MSTQLSTMVDDSWRTWPPFYESRKFRGHVVNVFSENFV